MATENQVVLNTKIQLRNDTKSNWATANPVLAKGEVGVEIDTNKLKVGDGSTAWADLGYVACDVIISESAPTSADVADLGKLWVRTTVGHVFVNAANDGTTSTWKRLAYADELTLVGESETAQKLKTARTISITGDGTGSTTFDGSADKSITLTLANTGATAGTYTKVTVNAKGLITKTELLTAADIPALTLSKITDAGTAASKNVGTAAGNVVEVGADGKIADSLIPAIAITDTYAVASQAEMLALNAQVGDVAIRSDVSKSYILKQAPANTTVNWLELKSPDCKVLSVNGKTGAVVLSTSDVAEGSNLYFTEARAAASFNNNFQATSSANLTDGATILHTTDTLVLDGGNA